MSRYTDMFVSHAYNAQFKNLTTLVEQMDIGDISQPANSSEIQRLKKVISYLNDILLSIDPELVPLNIWDGFYQYTQHTTSEVAAYISNRNIGHIVNANSYVDTLLNYVRPYMLLKGKAKAVGENNFVKSQQTLESLVQNFLNLTQEKLKVIEDNVKTSTTQTNSIQKLKKSIEDFHLKINGTVDEPGYSDLITATYKDISIKSDEVNVLHNDLLIDTATEPSLKTVITNIKNETLNDRNLVAKAKLDINSTLEELKAFYIRIFGKYKSKDERVGGLSSEITQSLSVLRELETSNKVRYDAIIENIASLVPSATSTGLAKAYQDMKNSFDGPILSASILFYTSVALLIICSYFSATTFSLTETKDGFHYTYDVVKYSTMEEALRLNLFKIPLWGAMVWLAVFASKRRSEFQRLQQEYAHKEAFASSYISYKQQIEALARSDSKLQDELIQKMIEAIAFNASQTLDGNHGDKHPLHTLLEKCTDKLSPSELMELLKRKEN